MGTLLALDLSTVSTGFALFDIPSRKLLHHGCFKQKKGRLGTKRYPKLPLLRIEDIVGQIKEYIATIPDLEIIAIEEVNGGVNRIAQKTLSGVHWILLHEIKDKIDLVFYKDSDGATGWRANLKLVLSEQDKLRNKEIKALNAKLIPRQRRYKPVTKKHLACRFVNKTYNLALDCEQRESDADIADAIGLGHSVLYFNASLTKPVK